MKVRPAVVTLDPVLVEKNDGQSFVAELDRVKADLETAQANQEVGLGQLPEETQRFYELKGRVLAMIEKVIRTGKRAFAGDVEKIGRFNKDLLLRARKKAKEQGKQDGEKKPAA